LERVLVTCRTALAFHRSAREMQFVTTNLTRRCIRNWLDISLINRTFVTSIHDIFILRLLTALARVTNLFGRIFDNTLSRTGDGT
jgi:hypothetical protein